MNTFAEFEIIGRVGQIKEGNGVLWVSIAAEYGRKDNHGDFQSKPFWNDVSIFNENVIKWVKENTVKGDLVRATGTIRSESYETNSGETRHGVKLACDNFANLTHMIRKQMERHQAG